MSSIPTVKLNTGAEIPAIGLGAWAKPEDRPKAATWFISALKAGYRHIDTASTYETETATGEAIRASGIPRNELFITTKLAWHHYDRVAESFNESLEKSGLDYFDLYLMHFPQALGRHGPNGDWKDADGNITIVDYPFTKIWADMEKLLDTGKVKAIGISNFSIKNTEELLKIAKIVPAVNQVELHPYLAQNDLLEYSKKKGIAITAYTPTGYATVREDATIQEIAKKHNATGAQVILSWHVSRGVVAVPRSSNEERQKENLRLIELDEEDIKKINALDRNERLCNKAGEDGKVWGWTYEQLGW